MKIKLPSMRLPMSTRIGHSHISDRDYDRSLEKMDIEQRVQEIEDEAFVSLRPDQEALLVGKRTPAASLPVSTPAQAWPIQRQKLRSLSGSGMSCWG